MKKIALIGTHGIGKTTTAYGIAYQFKKSRKTVTLLGETARQSPLPINQKGNVNSQMWVLGLQLIQESTINPKVDYAICDRSILDIYVYTYYLNPDFAESLLPFIVKYLKSYDFIFYLPVRHDYFQSDYLRSSIKKYQMDIDKIFNSIMFTLNTIYNIKIDKIINDKLVVERIIGVILSKC